VDGHVLPGQRAQEGLWSADTAEQTTVAAVLGEPVGALAGEHDAAALPDDLRGRAQAFNALVQVLIQRPAAVGGHDHVVGRLHADHRRLVGEAAAGPVAGKQLAGEDVGDRVPPVQGDVEVEGDPSPTGDRAHPVVHRVAYRHPPGRPGVADTRRRMQLEHGLQRCQARRNHLRSTREPGEEMRLDEPRGDAHGVVQERGLDQRRDDRARDGSEVTVARPVEGVMLDDLAAPEHLRTQHPLQLRRGALPVGARGHKDRHRAWAERVELLKQHRQHPRGWERAGHVADDHGDAGAALDQLAQRRTGERPAKGAPQRPALISQPALPARLDHVGGAGQVHSQPGPAVCQLDGGHRTNKPSWARRRPQQETGHHARVPANRRHSPSASPSALLERDAHPGDPCRRRSRGHQDLPRTRPPITSRQGALPAGSADRRRAARPR
jgi:hypothetical protein